MKKIYNVIEINNRLFLKIIGDNGVIVKDITPYKQMDVTKVFNNIFLNDDLISREYKDGVTTLVFKKNIIKIDDNYNKWAYNGEFQNAINVFFRKTPRNYKRPAFFKRKISDFKNKLIKSKNTVSVSNLDDFLSKCKFLSLRNLSATVIASSMIFATGKSDFLNFDDKLEDPFLKNSSNVSIKTLEYQYDDNTEVFEKSEFYNTEYNDLLLNEQLDSRIHSENLIKEQEEKEALENIEDGNEFSLKLENIHDYKMRDVAGETSRTDYVLGGNITDYTKNYMLNFLNSDAGKYLINCSETYGIDPFIVLSVAMGESALLHEKTLPGGSYHNGYAWGIMQHESPSGRKITAYNYDLNSYDVMYVNQSTASNIYTNIQMGVMRLQEVINKYNGNVPVALQAYNGGDGVPNIVISKFMIQRNMTRDEVLSDVSIEDFAYEFSAMSSNPSAYMNTLPQETINEHSMSVNYIKQFSSYGTGNYMAKTMGNYLGDEGVYKEIDSDGNITYKHYIYETDEIYEYDYSLTSDQFTRVK